MNPWLELKLLQLRCMFQLIMSRNSMSRKRKGITGRAVVGRCHQMKKPKKDETSSSDVPDWAGLNGYLLEDVIGRLPLADCLSFCSVCKPWRSVSTKYLDGCNRRVPFFVKRGDNERTSRICFNLLKSSEFQMELPEARGRMIFGSFEDWLFLGRKTEDSHLDISLLNPFSRENITLPRTSLTKYLMILSESPSDQNCVCLLAGSFGFVCFWTPGDREWRNVQSLSYNKILDALYYGGYFYLLIENYRIVIINKNHVNSVLVTEFGPSIPHQTLSLMLPDFPASNLCRHYLAESRGKVLLVSRLFSTSDAGVTETSAFETYTLDLHAMAWLKLEDLEDQILFVGSGCSRSFCANELGGALASYVYFINDSHCVSMNEWLDDYLPLGPENDSDDWGVLCTQKPNHWPSAFRAEAKYWAGVWLTAPVGWCFKQKRR